MHSMLSGPSPTRKVEKERARKQQQRDDATAIPPELLLRRDKHIRYERNGPVYATDGKVGVLKKVVVDEAAGEVTELIVLMDGGDRLVMIPPDVVDKSGGSALFLTINHVQFAERGNSGPRYVKGAFARADLKTLLKHDGRPVPMNHRRAVATAGSDYIETPVSSPMDRIQGRSESAAAD